MKFKKITLLFLFITLVMTIIPSNARIDNNQKLKLETGIYSVSFDLKLFNESQTIQFTLTQKHIDYINSIVSITKVHIDSIEISGGNLTTKTMTNLVLNRNLTFFNILESKNFSFSELNKEISNNLSIDLNFDVKGTIFNSNIIHDSFKAGVSFKFNNVYLKKDLNAPAFLIPILITTLIIIKLFRQKFKYSVF